MKDSTVPCPQHFDIKLSMTMARCGLKYPITPHLIKLSLVCNIVVLPQSYILRASPAILLAIFDHLMHVKLRSLTNCELRMATESMLSDLAISCDLDRLSLYDQQVAFSVHLTPLI